MDWSYINERLRRYNTEPSDDLLYRIGTHAEVLASGDGNLTPKERFEVLNWLECHGFSIDHDLALLIFGKKQLSHWLAVSRQAYPDFEFYLCFEYQPQSKTGWESGINYTCFWMPKPGAPVPDTEMDFPWKVYWDCGEQFWGNFPNSTTNELEFTMSVYPNQQSFTVSNWILEEGDWQCTPTDQEADLMSVAQVLEHFTVPV